MFESDTESFSPVIYFRSGANCETEKSQTAQPVTSKWQRATSYDFVNKKFDCAKWHFLELNIQFGQRLVALASKTKCKQTSPHTKCTKKQFHIVVKVAVVRESHKFFLSLTGEFA
jgi:hypothetical protein